MSKQAEKKHAGFERKTEMGPSAFGGTGEEDERKINYEELFGVHTKAENANNINFENRYKGDLPQKAKELKSFVDRFKDKDTSKDKEIVKYKKNAEDKLRRVKNLVPDNKIQISALRMDDDFLDPNDRRNKDMAKMVKANI